MTHADQEVPIELGAIPALPLSTRQSELQSGHCAVGCPNETELVSGTSPYVHARDNTGSDPALERLPSRGSLQARSGCDLVATEAFRQSAQLTFLENASEPAAHNRADPNPTQLSPPPLATFHHAARAIGGSPDVYPPPPTTSEHVPSGPSSLARSILIVGGWNIRDFRVAAPVMHPQLKYLEWRVDRPLENIDCLVAHLAAVAQRVRKMPFVRAPTPLSPMDTLHRNTPVR